MRPCFGVRPSLGLGYENFRQLMLVKPDLRLRLPLKRDELGFGKNLRARRAWRAVRLNYADLRLSPPIAKDWHQLQLRPEYNVIIIHIHDY